MEYSERKSPRLKGFDYSAPGIYFVTVCTYKMRMLFWENPMCPDAISIADRLNFAGKIAEDAIRSLPEKFPVKIDKYVVMPNHIHLILTVKELEMKNERIGTVSLAIRNIKMNISKQLHNLKIEDSIWQRSFHDHIIRNEKEYQMIWQYIENNPRKWAEDCFYNKR